MPSAWDYVTSLPWRRPHFRVPGEKYPAAAPSATMARMAQAGSPFVRPGSSKMALDDGHVTVVVVVELVVVRVYRGRCGSEVGDRPG
jgi:hypothetical protein